MLNRIYLGRRDDKLKLDAGHRHSRFSILASRFYSKLFFPVRVVRGIALLLAICCAGGCIATQLKAGSCRPVQTDMQVFVNSAPELHWRDNICIFPFSAPLEFEAASYRLTSAFQANLVQRGTFRQTTALHYEVKSDAEALWYARNEGFALVMLPSLLYMLDGTGALPTQLDVRTRILDARTGNLLWDIKQCARLEPGPDIDLTWNTLVGQPAQRCQVMADRLAQQFAAFLAPPPPEK